MKKILAITLASFLIADITLADSDCNTPVIEWQPREVLQQHIQNKGWEVKRITIDDGCYEVKGIDRNGNRFKAKYEPASLEIRELEIKFDNFGDASDYLDQNTDLETKPANTSLNYRT